MCTCTYVQIGIYYFANTVIQEKTVMLSAVTRCMWNRIFAVNLFIQHVCPPGTKDQLAVKKLMPLWNVSAILYVGLVSSLLARSL